MLSMSCLYGSLTDYYFLFVSGITWLCTQGAGPIIMSEMRRKEEKMINMRKRKEVIGDKNGETEVTCPMMNYIAKMTAIDFDESGEFEYDQPHTVLLCNLILGLYSRGEYKEAMTLLAVAFMMVDMEDSAEMIGAAAAGYTEEKGKFFLEQFFDRSGLIETYLLGLEIYGEEEEEDGRDDSYM